MFLGIYWNEPVCPSIDVLVYVSVCVQNSSSCQSAGEGINSVPNNSFWTGPN